MLKFSLFIISLFSFSVTANQITVSDFTVREFIPGAPSSVAYFQVENTSEQMYRLTGAKIDHIGRVEIHNHIAENGMMKMVKVSDVEIAPKSTVVFQSGGLHLMLYAPDRKLVKDENLNVTLTFKDGLEVKAKAHVVSLADAHEQAHHHHHH